MSEMMKRLQRRCVTLRGCTNPERGASMVEYAILVGVLAAVVLAAALFVGGQISALMGGINLST